MVHGGRSLIAGARDYMHEENKESFSFAFLTGERDLRLNCGGSNKAKILLLSFPTK